MARCRFLRDAPQGETTQHSTCSQIAARTPRQPSVTMPTTNALNGSSATTIEWKVEPRSAFTEVELVEAGSVEATKAVRIAEKSA